MAKKIQMMSHDKEWQMVDGVETLVPVEQFDIDPVTDSSCVKIEGFRTLEETLNEKNMFTPEVNATKVMDKVGGEYHQNVVDGAYEEAILYGNTQVNLCEEDSSNALQIPTTFTSFNNGELQINNKENQVVAPLIKGVTMVNLAQTNSASITSGNATVIRNVKGNTVYTLSFTFTTKNTNSGVTIQCYDGNGTFIENTIHKTGLGDDVKFIFTTHANATKIHICNNVAYGGETIQLDEIMLIEGDQTGLDIPFFKGMKSVELVRPLTNLFTDDITTYESGASATNSSGNVVVTSKSSSSWSSIAFKMNMLKNNTKYLVMWDSLNTTQTSTSNTGHLISIYYVDTNSQNIGTINNNTLCPTKKSLIFDTKDFDVAKIWLKIHATLNNTETGTTTVTGLRVFEYDDYLRSVDLQSIGWFSGTKNVSIPNFKTNSKNLYPYGDVNFTNSYVGWCDAKGNTNMYGDIAQKSKCRFLLRKGTYTFFYNGEGNTTYAALVDDKENTIAGGKTSFTLQQDTYLTLRLKTLEADTQTTLTNIQIERGSTKTDYVAYDTRQYKPDNQEVVVLRSLPNGVCDTFNLQTGEYVQRIGEAILDGTETQWNASQIQETDNYVRTWQYIGSGGNNNFITLFPNMKYTVATAVVNFNNDKLLSLPYDTFSNNQVVGFALKNTTMNQNEFQIRLPKSELASNDVAGIKTWLQQNPLKIYYELAEPIIKQIPIINNVYNASSKVDFKEGKNVNFRCFGNPTYLEVGSLSPVNPIVEPIINVPLNARLKANTSYTVRLDRTGSSLNVDLGGTTVSTSNSTDNEFIIKTPTGMLSHNQIRFSGSGSVGRVMVFEGDIRGIELPYFMGINNVKMPIVRNCGKNLVDFDRDKTNWWVNNEGLSKGDDTGLYYSVMIKASGGNRYRIAMKNTNRSHYGFLDEDFNILVLNANNRDTVVAPKNTKYLIWYLSSTGLTSENNVQIELVENNNLIPTSYEQYRGNDICLVQGEIGLSQDMFEQGTTAQYSANIGKTYQWMKENSAPSYDVGRLRLKELIKIQPNTKLILQNTDNFMYAIAGYDANKLSLGTFDTTWIQNTTITIPQDVHYISFAIRKKDDTNITINDFNQTNFALLKPDKTIALRSLPNGVKDELNLLTGEYIQRVGEVVLDGSDDLTYNYESNSNDTTTMVHIPNLNKNRVFNFCNDKLIQRFVYDKTYIIEGIFSEWNGLYVRLLNTKLSSPNPDGVKQYLQSNPITVQYELAEPIISYPRIVSNTQEREVGIKLPNGVCDTYNPSTGITVKRVGKVVLDGSEKWNRDGSSTKPTDLERFSTPIEDMVSSPYNTGNFVVETSGYNIVNNDKTSPRKLPNIWNYYQANIYLDFATTAFGMTTGDSVDAKISKLKTYLASNPITIYYELKNPIITTDIVLPNGVHDEYNPITGLYTKRVGFIELDGSEDWAITGTNPFAYVMLNPIAKTQSMIISNFVANGNVASTSTELGAIIVNPNSEMCLLRVRTQDILNGQTLSDFKTYLSQNPIKLWYELATPQKIQLTPYFGLPMPYAYQGGHLIMDSAYNGVSLPPEFKYKLVANRTGQITQNNIKLQNHTSKLSNLEAMLVDATLQSMYEREMMAFNLEMVNINLINLEE